jgi:superfamily I DNA/RNA helicase
MSSTPEQIQAVEVICEHKVILALPGSGKTHSLVSYVERILHAYPDSKIILVTFTNASADEMAERIKSRLPMFIRNVRVGTFASIILSMFKPLSQGRRLILGAEWKSYIRRAAFKNGFSTEDLPDLLEYVETVSRAGGTSNPFGPFYQVYQDYLNMLSMYNRVDPHMVSREVTKAIREGRIQPLKANFMMVDEFQDVSMADFEWVSAHTDSGIWTTVVGDDDQSIYGWRGAEGYESIVLMQEMHNAKGYLLSQCFRCAPTILAAAKRLIEHNEERVPKKMSSARSEKGKVERIVIPKTVISAWTEELKAADVVQTNADKRKKTGKPSVEELKKEAEDKAMEKARFIVEHIKDESPYEWAILARTNAELDLIERALAERRLNAIRLGGKSIFDNEHANGIAKLMLGVLDRKHIAHVVDGLGWLGEDEDIIQKIYFSAGNGGFASVSSLNSSDWLPETIELQGMAQTWLTDTISPLVIKERMDDFFNVLVKRINSREDGDMKLQLAIVKVFKDVLESSKGSFAERIVNVADRVMNNTRNKVDHRAPDVVKLATLTGSKGLEWKYVWIINVDDGRIPSAKSIELKCEDAMKAAVEEERRLMYVGMTRAELWLRISYTEEQASTFIGEIFGFD